MTSSTLTTAVTSMTITGRGAGVGQVLGALPGAYVIPGGADLFSHRFVVIPGESFKVQDPSYPGLPQVAWGVAVNGGGMGVHPSLTPAYGQVIADILTVHDSNTPTIKYGVSLAEVQQFHEALVAGWPISVSGGGFGMHDAMSVIQGVQVLNQINIHPVLTPTAKYGVVLTNAILLNAGLFRFFSGTLSDGIGIHDGNILSYLGAAAAIENLGIHDAWTPSLVFGLTLPEGVNMHPNQVLKMIFQGDHIAEGIVVSSLMVMPNGNYTTWAMNTRTGAVTEYQNYVFNSFAKLGGTHHYLGASTQSNQPGIFVLDGERDLTTNIIADIKGGRMAPGGSKFTSFRSAYLGLTTRDDDTSGYILKMVAADGREYVYNVKAQPEGVTTKVNMGKGLRSRYFSYELVSTGADFDLDAIEFVPIVSTRRV